MARLKNSLRRGFKAAANYLKPGEFKVAGKKVVCFHCGGTEFERSNAQLNTATASLVNLDWLNTSAHILTCRNCGRIEWFMNDPDKID
jgi:predicted nucleic-acid-binding Zn-ribbon protein